MNTFTLPNSLLSPNFQSPKKPSPCPTLFTPPLTSSSSIPQWPCLKFASPSHRQKEQVVIKEVYRSIDPLHHLGDGTAYSILAEEMGPDLKLFEEESLSMVSSAVMPSEYYGGDGGKKQLSSLMIHPSRMEFASSRHRRKDKVVVIMGATGSGKSRLSVELATVFPFSEIINSDKMQVYRGLDITTNKIPFHQRNNVPHHLLGDVDTSHGEFSPYDFRRHAGDLISDITSRRKLPIIVGGSNSFIHALLVERFDPESNLFEEESPSMSISTDLRYKCYFLWMDISFPVLSEYLLKRVDDMFDSGMVDELAEFYEPDADNGTGLRKAIGVSEFDRFFKEYSPAGPMVDSYMEAVKAIKNNRCQQAKKQIGKIQRLKRAGWDLRRIDATEAFRAVMTSASHGGDGGGEEYSDVWKKQVLEPSVKIVKRFLME